MKIAAMADLHVGQPGGTDYAPLFGQLSDLADVLVLAGDLTDRGEPAQAEKLAEQLRGCTIPVVGVLGNHDYDAGAQDAVREILGDVGMRLLNGGTFIHHDVGFAGVKGFGGGFENRMLAAFGEDAVKAFVEASVREALKLENAMTRLETSKKIAITHYAPIRATVVGEPDEIFPYLGSSRLVRPMDNFRIEAAFHGHAHHGSPAGNSSTGVPVFNVSYPLLRQQNPEQPFFIYEL
jgi:Icc-related predicted phosphoesterase